MASNSKRLFFQELKDEYNAQFELNNVLEGKSGQIITVCGIFIPLVFGFSSITVDGTVDNHSMVYILQAILGITLSLAVVSIFFCAWTLRIQSYSHAFLPDSFYKNGNLDPKEINDFGNKKEEEFYDEMIEEYLESNKHNLNMNKKKAEKIKIAQYFFLLSLGLVPFLVAISFSV